MELSYKGVNWFKMTRPEYLKMNSREEGGSKYATTVNAFLFSQTT